MAASYIKFNVEMIPYNVNSNVSPGVNCNALTFLNIGTAAVTIDSLIVLQQGQSYAIDGNLGEVFGQQTFNIGFAAGGTNQMILIRKIYS